MKIYLDNAASTRPFDEVAEYFKNTMLETYANPSALHSFGTEALQICNYAEEQILKTAGLENRDIIFTSGATESANLAIKGILDKLGGIDKCEIITSSFEHACVTKVFEFYSKKGLKTHYVPVDKYGKLDIECLIDSVNDYTRLVSLIWVNNEIGSVNDVNTILHKVKEKNPRVITHVDAVQGFGKIPCNLTNADMITLSAHKFHGPKGLGALITTPHLVLSSQILGGGHQNNLRSGTINAPGIGAMGKACEIINKAVYPNNIKETQLYLFNKLKNEFSLDIINSRLDLSDFAPHIISISFEGLKGEVILHMLEEKDIYISTASACSSNKTTPSVLNSLGFNKKRIEGTVRISLSEFTTHEQIDVFIENLKNVTDRLKGLGRI